MIASVFSPDLKKYEGKTVAEMAASEHKTPIDALMDFVIKDNLQTGALYFIASEPDLQTGLKQSWTSIGLDANENRWMGHYLIHTTTRGRGERCPDFWGTTRAI